MRDKCSLELLFTTVLGVVLALECFPGMYTQKETLAFAQLHLPMFRGSVDSISLTDSKRLWVPENQAPPEF